MVEERENRIYQFGDFRLHADEYLLLRGGEHRIELSPRNFALLVKLVENAGRLLKKEILLKEVWADSVVEEGNLNHAISKIRKTLGEKPNENRFIETVPRFGYRFVASVELISNNNQKSTSHDAPTAHTTFTEVTGSTIAQASVLRPSETSRRRRWLISLLALVLVATSALLFLAWRKRQGVSVTKKETVSARAPVRLTNHPNDDVNPRWTKDGRIRFLRTGANRHAESWVMNGDGTSQTIVKDFPNLKFGIWSLDESKVIFEKPNDSSAYYLANADGKNETALPFFRGNFDWSADGKQIVYQKVVDGNSDIFIYSVETKTSRNITNHAEFDADPTFSPDGRQVAFASARDGNLEIYLMNAEGGDVRRLTDNPSVDNHPVFSPDGTQIAFGSDRENENSDVYLVNVDGSGQTLKLTHWDTAEWVEPGCWSPDGTKIAFISDRHEKDDIFVMDAEAFRTQTILADERGNLGFASYAPDGKRIVYQAEMEDGGRELRILDLETEQSRRLTETKRAGVVSNWSPDGEWIVFQNYADGNTEIYLIKPDGNGLKNLTNNSARDVEPAWSPDGRQIVFASNRDGLSDVFQLYLMNSDGSDQRRLNSINASSTAPAWMPDGRRILFSNDKEDGRTGNFEIFSLDLEGDQLIKRLTFRRGFDMSPSVSPDGKRIAFVSEADGNPEIYLMNSDGTGVLRITRDTAIDTSPHWSPDGKSLLFSSNRNGKKFALYSLTLE